MNKKNNQTLLHLSLIDEVGPATVLRLLQHVYQEKYPDMLHVGWEGLVEHQEGLFDLAVLYDYSAADFMRCVGLSDHKASALFGGLKDRALLDAELTLADKHEVQVLTILDSEYPEILKQIHVPPIVLYYQGALFQSKAKRIAFVGSRQAGTYARTVVQNLVPGLVERGWHIVSGGAEGADTMAHATTLEAGGLTVAVIGSGLLQPYPNSNRDLFRRMVERGSSIVSPFSLRTLPDKGTFPARNRVIAGLSLGCVIVQAAVRSGALITANFALEQGRQVFAVPGPINDVLSAGCHGLIKQGAKLVNQLNDILEEFGERIESAAKPVAAQAQRSVSVRPAKQLEKNDPILNLLSQPATFDELVEKSGFDADTLQDRLFTLQLEGRVRQNFVGTWESVEG